MNDKLARYGWDSRFPSFTMHGSVALKRSCVPTWKPFFEREGHNRLAGLGSPATSQPGAFKRQVTQRVDERWDCLVSGFGRPKVLVFLCKLTIMLFR